MGLQDFETLFKLGEGSYSKVYKVIRLTDGAEYAMKKVKLEDISETERLNALNEVRILASIESRFVISYREAFVEGDSLYIIMEFAPGGDLKKAIKARAERRDRFKEAEVWKLAYEITSGLKALHARKVIHCDMKSANVFLTEEGSKLADMNVSKVTKNGLIYTQTGTPYYAAPEVWRDQPFDNRSDIWSLGVILYEVLAFELPFKGESMEQLSNAVNQGQYKNLPQSYSLELRNLVASLLQLNPADRPSCEQLLQHSKFRHFPQDNTEQSLVLLKTIKLQDFELLKKVLPKPKYHQNRKSLERKSSLSKEKTPRADKAVKEDSSPHFKKKYSQFRQSKEITTRQQTPQTQHSGSATKRVSQRNFQPPAYPSYQMSKVSADRIQLHKCISTNEIRERNSPRLNAEMVYSPSYKQRQQKPTQNYRNDFRNDFRNNVYGRQEPRRESYRQVQPDRSSFFLYQPERMLRESPTRGRDYSSSPLRRQPSVQNYRPQKQERPVRHFSPSKLGLNAALICKGYRK